MRRHEVVAGGAAQKMKRGGKGFPAGLEVKAGSSGGAPQQVSQGGITSSERAQQKEGSGPRKSNQRAGKRGRDKKGDKGKCDAQGIPGWNAGQVQRREGEGEG